MAKFTSFVAEVKEKVSETESTETLRFEKPGGFSFRPGQFVTMQFIGPDGNPERTIRSFTISSSPHENLLDITVKREGVMSNRMCDSQPGTKFRMSGPFGNFVLDGNSGKRHAFLAGGSGIAPFRSYLRYALESGLKESMTLFYSNRDWKNVIFRKELGNYAGKSSMIKNVFCVTGDSPVSDGEGNFEIVRGRIKKELILEKLGNDVANTIFYACGSKEFVNGMLDILKEMCIEPGNIRTERWN